MRTNKKTQLKLYVWHKSLCDWTPGVMFALAASADEARALITKEHDDEYVRVDLEEKPSVYDAPVGFAVFGGG